MRVTAIDKKFKRISLKGGKHTTRASGMCAMELVAYMAGEKHTDTPECACPIITHFVVSWNDSLYDNASRNRWIKPVLPQVIDSIVRTSKGELDTDVLVKRVAIRLEYTLRNFLPLDLEMIADCFTDKKLSEAQEALRSAGENLRKIPSIKPISRGNLLGKDSEALVSLGRYGGYTFDYLFYSVIKITETPSKNTDKYVDGASVLLGISGALECMQYVATKLEKYVDTDAGVRLQEIIKVIESTSRVVLEVKMELSEEIFGAYTEKFSALLDMDKVNEECVGMLLQMVAVTDVKE